MSEQEQEQQLHFEDITDEPEDFQGDHNDDDEDDDYDPRPLTDSSVPIIPHRDYPLNEKEIEVPETKGNVFKTVLKEGTGNKYPPLGSQVKVWYCGRLSEDMNSAKFDSARDRNQPFEFELGGGVILGWNTSIQTMKVGERALVKIKAPYGYGESGSPPKIPGGATLYFDIELISFEKKAEDVSKNRDKSVMKTATLTQPATANKREHPDYESNVKFDVEVFKGDVDLEDEEQQQEAAAAAFGKKDWSFELGDFDVPVALYDAICSMRKGEVATFHVRGRHAHEAFAELAKLILNKTDDDDASPLSFTLKLTMHEFDVKKTWGFKNEEKIEEALKRKEQGNNYFKAKSLAKALKKYDRAVAFVENDYGLDTEELKQKAAELYVTVLGNVAQCHLTLGNFKACVDQCDKILEQPSTNNNATVKNKALFRKAKALTQMQEFDDAEQLLRQILVSEPNNADVTNTLNDVLAKKKAFNQKQKALFGKMFA